MNIKKIHIKGMHCRSCELLIADEISQVTHVEDVNVDFQKGTADIFYKKQVNYADITKAVRNAGYDIGRDEPKPWFSRNMNDYLEVAMLSVLLMVMYYIAVDTGLFELLSVSSNNLGSLPVVFMLGLTAGLSTCAALVGGLILSVSARYAEKHADATTQQKFVPHIYFNIGRVIGFFILGGVMGLIGSVFQMSLGFLGLLTIVIGLAMLVFGMQLTELFPRLSKVNITIPAGVAKYIGLKEQTDKEYSHRNALVLGGLTFFLPCGFTQLIQLYAISTANPLTAALTMGVFAIGTTPGLLGIGGLTSVVTGAFAKPFFRFAGLVVIALAMFNISNGLTLSGWKTTLAIAPSAESVAAAASNGEVQIIKATYTDANDLQPNRFSVKAGQSVRFEINVKDDGYGCMGSMALPGLSRQIEMLRKGVPMVFEFTPEKAGRYDIACAMGVPRGSITVL